MHTLAEKFSALQIDKSNPLEPSLRQALAKYNEKKAKRKPQKNKEDALLTSFKNRIKSYERGIKTTRSSGLFNNLCPCSSLEYLPGKTAQVKNRSCTVLWSLSNGKDIYHVVLFDKVQKIAGVPGKSSRWAVVSDTDMNTDSRHVKRQARARKLVRLNA